MSATMYRVVWMSRDNPKERGNGDWFGEWMGLTLAHICGMANRMKPRVHHWLQEKDGAE